MVRTIAHSPISLGVLIKKASLFAVKETPADSIPVLLRDERIDRLKFLQAQSITRVYTGKTETLPQHGLGHQILTTMIANHFMKNHSVHYDNFFSSVELAKDLK
ncbi:hypothetical protein ElyMa_003897400 [Elysia marginata]|uniref:PiggyBac transposable element-derived protein domain-containing protein n=1 Tax=Elysia marginata TaxID=1093978 RepID=A0AAV4FQU2_9GAST|nr:hypothetical protein ElyMa_003897400 [Elysia marginata]